MSRFYKRLQRLPQHVQSDVTKVIRALEDGTPLRDLDGAFIRRLKRGGQRIYSLKIGKHYRVLCEQANSGLKPTWVGSHSEYDKVINQY
jgi:mRNA-degrading endonuclease RelE of RelBE toxin-antitoxin system